MGPLEKAIFALEIAFAAAILSGLGARRRYRASVSFDAYLFSILVFEWLILFWPGRFFNWNFWFAKEVIQSLLKVAICLELALRIFWSLPRVRFTAGVGILLIVLGTAVSVIDTEAANTEVLALTVMPRVFYGTAIMFGLILTLALWYRVPLEELHKAILMGFAPYLLLFTVGVQIFESLGEFVRIPVSYANNVAFFCLLSYWARIAWRRSTRFGEAL